MPRILRQHWLPFASALVGITATIVLQLPPRESLPSWLRIALTIASVSLAVIPGLYSFVRAEQRAEASEASRERREALADLKEDLIAAITPLRPRDDTASAWEGTGSSTRSSTLRSWFSFAGLRAARRPPASWRSPTPARSRAPGPISGSDRRCGAAARPGGASSSSAPSCAPEAGLATYQGKALVNSVTGEEERLEAVLPLVKRYGAAVIGMAHDERGISEDPEVRFAVARKIVERATAYGIPREDMLIDPLAMPVGAMPRAGATMLAGERRVRQELGVATICGVSNISFRLPGRARPNATFLAMAIAAGMACAIANPLNEGIRTAIAAADVLLGKDEDCRARLRAYRLRTAGQAGERADNRARRGATGES